MEKISILLNKAEEFDRRLKNSLPEGGDLEVITKDNATAAGAPAVMITFSVQIPDGTRANAQSVTTLKAFLGAVGVLRAKYGHLENL